jgi:H+/gluconate symporter-like permease
MSDTLIVLHTAIAIIVIVLLILFVRIDPVTALAIGSGALFALQVNSNFFWMFQSLLGVTTQGALKALTLVTALASAVSLVLILPLSLVV